MHDRDATIKKIQSLPDKEFQEVAKYIDLLEEKTTRKRRSDALSQVIGICEGSSDLADKHDSYVY